MRTRTTAIGVAALLAISLVGCQSDAPPTDSGTGEPASLTNVKVGVIPIFDVAPLYLGIAEGFFEEEGLEITVESAQGAAAMVPAVLNEEYQFGYGNNLTLLLGAEQGLDLRIVSSGVIDSEANPMTVFVRNDSDIESAADLAGRTVAINALKNVGEVGVRAAVDGAGADSSKVEFVEAPFPQTASLLLDGQVDAAWVLEPFLTPVLDEIRPVLEIRSEIADPLAFASYFTSERFASQNREVVLAFQRAMNRSLDFAAQNPDAVRAVIPEYLDIPAEAVSQLLLPVWGSEIDRSSLSALGKTAVTYGVLTKEPDIDALFID